ncbi:hypothetical protein AAHA92_11887 [Salvia divinorum]|uniref:DUF7797 domain-containing protein n=1 Tax=Salvia divinorum TaxID=28513 RepID=A0ABD1HIH3_SALDI
MESAVDTPEARSEPVGEKRAAEEHLDLSKDASPPPPKRSRGVGERHLLGDVRKVAEMVLVLAAMGKMRGGKGPTDVEKELMAEARNKLAQVCEGFAPKDVFPSEGFGGVIEDLGLNKLKEQKLGFRPPKMSIAEKLLVSKKKVCSLTFEILATLFGAVCRTLGIMPLYSNNCESCLHDDFGWIIDLEFHC